FPLTSIGLKEVGRYLGCSWSDAYASGLKSIILRDRWEKGRDVTLKRELECYNLEDRLALKRVAELVYTICEEAKEEKVQLETSLGGCIVARAEDMNTEQTHCDYGKDTFVLSDFEHINERAYFDYQRDKVYLSGCPTITSAFRGVAMRPDRVVP